MDHAERLQGEDLTFWWLDSPRQPTTMAMLMVLDRPPDPTRLRALVPGIHYGMTVGAGHFCQLEVPDQVNAMIDRFLAVAT